ncbi:hypothetical protein HKD37_17G048090 [Glycine soja]
MKKGKRVSLKFLVGRLNKMWARIGMTQTLDLHEDYFLVSFSHEQDYKFVLLEGLWLIFYPNLLASWIRIYWIKWTQNN